MAYDEKQSKFLNELGFDNTHQWLLYVANMQNFFEFFSKNIKPENVLTQNEVLEAEELHKKNLWLDRDSLDLKKLELEAEHPGLFQYNESHIEDLENEIKLLEKATSSYNKMSQEIRQGLVGLNSECSNLQQDIRDLEVEDRNLADDCLAKAKALEELQKENKNLYMECKKAYTTHSSPPLFIHQMPLNQYFQKCDVFMQYFNLYMKEHFKIQNQSTTADIDNLNTSNENSEIYEELGSLEKMLFHYTFEYLKEKSRTKATETLIDVMNISKMTVARLEDMKNETKELEVINEHLTLNNKTLLEELESLVGQYVSQRIEMLLYENTKVKYERALKRQENDKHLSKIITEALLNAELVWILMQLDLEKADNFFDNTDQLAKQAVNGWQRINYMKSVQNLDTGVLNPFIDKFSHLLGKHLKRRIPADANVCLQQYQKLETIKATTIKNLVDSSKTLKKCSKWIELIKLEKRLIPLVYDGPLKVPILENVKYLRRVIALSMKQEKCHTEVNLFRNLYKENVTEKFKKDKLWRYKQFLWIWFLTHPKRVQMAIEEVKQEAAKASAGMKALGGILRKQ